MNIRFTPGPFERAVENGRILLPEEYVRAITEMQKRKELACVTDDRNLAVCYPIELCERIFKMVGELKEHENPRDAAKRILSEPWLGLFLGNCTAEILDIDKNNRLYIPRSNPLYSCRRAAIQGFTDYFTITGKIQANSQD